ncbi:hypothetical protein [Nonomuraea candida]|uniref:hypothetical protein n=1 Tax=Nonomuraea candida TaxID=359159 RepID=UPI000ADDF7F9|nr:hypothetical protein [Nonomuraea candida]
MSSVSIRARVTRSACAAVAAAVAFATPLLVSSPAQAAGWTCDAQWSTRDFSLPGKPDVRAWGRSCIYKDGNTRRGRVQIKWKATSSADLGKRFDKFSIQARLERNDKVIAGQWCDITGALNGEDEGSETCTTSYVTSTSQYEWTGDGKVVYNINDDGLDDYVWNLHGSPEVKIAPSGLEAGDEPEPAPQPDPADTPDPQPAR